MTDIEVKNIFPEELIIDPKKGFDEHDIFGWKQQGEGLIDLLNSTTQQMVIGLDSPWGSGKTTFLKMLSGELKKQNGEYSVIYFDAFEVDYMDDPFIALVGEISAHIEIAKSLEEKVKNEFSNKAIKLGKVLSKSAVKVAVKAITLNAIDIENVEDDIARELAKSAESIFDKEVESSINAYKEKKTAVKGLKSSLSDIAEKLTDDDKPLVFIVDELDRCKPDFALRILEQIKHLFSTPNVHFILSADFNQLGAMVKKAYGNDYDSEKYFHKFRDYSFSLKHQDPVINYLKKYCSGTILNKISHNNDSLFYCYLKRLHKIHGLSLRDLQKILNTISIKLKNPDYNETHDAVYIALVAMKIIDPKLFFKAKNGDLQFDDLSRFFLLGENELDNHIFLIIEIWIKGHFNLLNGDEYMDYDGVIFDVYQQANLKHQQNQNQKQIVDMCDQLNTG